MSTVRPGLSDGRCFTNYASAWQLNEDLMKKLKKILEEYVAKPLNDLLTVEYLFYSEDRERTQREYTEFLMSSYI